MFLLPVFVVLLGILRLREVGGSTPTSQPTAGIRPFSWSPSTSPSSEQPVTPTSAPLLTPTSQAPTGGVPSLSPQIQPTSTSVAPTVSAFPTSVSVTPSPSSYPTGAVSMIPTAAGTTVAEHGLCDCSWTCNCDTNAVCHEEPPTAAPTAELLH